ncbi:MAG: Lrp/AsnC family transcriptional regulator [Chloroflexi bacterium]|nr:Lrp/AsnC family transcriptional regulator [Chloroflexota bacterium]
MATVALDETDLKIIELLQQDARMTNAAVAAAVGLSAPSVFERIRKLEQRRVIQRYTVTVDPVALGKTLTAFIRITVAYDEKHDPGIEAISRDPDVLELYSVAGEDCFIIKTRVGSADELQAVINRIRAQVTILRSVTMIALSTLKENAPISTAPPNGKAKTKTPTRTRR